MRTSFGAAVYSFLGLMLLAPAAFSCPLIHKIPDFNCDGIISVAVLGDSIAYGMGDTNNTGGYPLRLSRKLRFATITNLGDPGMRTPDLMATLKEAFTKKPDGKLAMTLREADVVIIDGGRNDRWLFGTPQETYSRLKTIRTSIVRNVQKLEGAAPLVVIAVMMLPNRGSQGPWMKELNRIILEGSTLSGPSDLRFDLVSKRLLQPDQIHPTPKGYDELAKVLMSYLTKTLPRRMLKLRPDHDKDGIFDLFEGLLYRTDPANRDTDGDGKTDGQEVFVSHTDPLMPE